MNSKVWSSIVKEAFEAGLSVGKFFCALHVTNTYFLTTALVHGPSMLPTFDITGDLVLAERISTRFEKLSRGDVILTRSPENPRKVVTKRLTGIEGDSITCTVDPKSDKHRLLLFLKGMFGLREITSMFPMIRGSLALFLMDLYKAEYFGKYGLLKLLDQWQREHSRVMLSFMVHAWHFMGLFLL